MIEKLKEDGECFLDENGVSWENKEDYLQTYILGFCGCGDPFSLMLYVKEMLVKIENKEFGKYEDMPYMFFANWGNHNGFLEYGSTIRCPWLSERGRELLKDIDIIIQENNIKDGKS